MRDGIVRKSAAGVLGTLAALAVGCASSSGPLAPVSGASAAPLSSAAAQWSVAVVDEYGSPLPTYRQGASTWVEGVYGRRYSVQVHNHSAERVEAVVTVDGRDVISGDVGDFTAQRGYVIDPYGSVTVEGFRQSQAQVASFRFTRPGDSYSARRGTPGNLGVIGVAVFPEEAALHTATPPPPPRRAWWGRGEDRERDAPSMRKMAPAEASAEGLRADDGAAAPSGSAGSVYQPAPSRPRAGNLGTQYGEARHSSTVETPFRRRDAATPAAILGVYYDDHEGLVARGILPDAPPPIASPQPFPNAQRFAPPPPR